MPRFVALLRAINVGGHVVKMDVLRAHFEALGFADVSTHIASGNVLFTTRSARPEAMERRIAEALETALGYPVATFLRTPAEMAAAAAHEPFADLAAGDALSVGFLQRALSAAERRTVQTFATPLDGFAVHAREVYWRRKGRVSESKFTLTRFEKAVGTQATFRNITTVRALAKLLSV